MGNRNRFAAVMLIAAFIPAYAWSAPKAPAPQIGVTDTARAELSLSDSERTTTIKTTPATVRPQVNAFETPIAYTALQIGASVMSYHPDGVGQVSGLAPYDLSSLGSRPMLTLDLRWQPFEVAAGSSKFLFGGFANAGYAQHDVQLRAPTGVLVPETKLHTLKSSFGLASSWNLPNESRWSLALLSGLGYLNSVQASQTNFANKSESVPYATASFLVQNRFAKKWTAVIGYEWRDAIENKAEGARVQRDTFLAGFLGSFR